MSSSRYRCVSCDAGGFRKFPEYWECTDCHHRFPCVDGLPRLYLEAAVGGHDARLLRTFYGGIFGRYYHTLMPFLLLPVRANFQLGWAIFGALWLAFVALVAFLGWRAASILSGAAHLQVQDVLALSVLAAAAAFLATHRYLFWVLLLALPVKLAILRRPFQPKASFAGIHRQLIDELKAEGRRLQVLDISTGTCASLYRHGWMELDADYTGLDLSETMLRQGRAFMAAKGVPIELVLGDAMALPFQADSFDVVLNYGALNGISDPALALAEMARVLRPGGLMLVLDEQMYEAAGAVERAYFHRVLSSHNVIHHCPVEALPPGLERVEVHQIYQFYYILTARKPESRRPGQSAGARVAAVENGVP